MPKTDPAPTRPIRLLVVEDDVDQRDLIRETLDDHFGVGTATAVATLAAAATLDASSFDMILTDYNLSDGCGMELLDRVRTSGDTPVIMVTGENVGRTAAEAIRRGATDYIVKVGDYLFTIPVVVEKNLTVTHVKRENARLALQLERTLLELQFKNGQLEESLQRMERMASTDPLTQLYNRRHFGRVLEQLFSESKRFGADLSCAMIDLDGYKQLNDSLGHQLGDQLLIAAGSVIGGSLRKMDIAARYGGDEFVLLLPRAAAAESAVVAARIREDYFKASAAILRRDAGVRMSIGISSVSVARPTDSDGLVAAADRALYRAKQAGRDRIEVDTGDAPSTHRAA